MEKWEKVYRKNKDIVPREIDNELILMPIYRTKRDINEMYVLNETGRDIWKLLDGKKTLEEIANGVCLKYKTSRERVETDITEFIKDMKGIKAIA